MINDYDVEDDLPQNVTAVATGNKVVRATKQQFKEMTQKKDQEEGKIARKPRPKLDFNRLLKGSRGLGYLAVCTRKSLKLNGKPGSESNDLSQISVYLQEWAKLVFPKMPLMEFLLKVEDICQSRVMKVHTRVLCLSDLFIIFRRASLKFWRESRKWAKTSI